MTREAIQLVIQARKDLHEVIQELARVNTLYDECALRKKQLETCKEQAKEAVKAAEATLLREIAEEAEREVSEPSEVQGGSQATGGLPAMLEGVQGTSPGLAA